MGQNKIFDADNNPVDATMITTIVRDTLQGLPLGITAGGEIYVKTGAPSGGGGGVATSTGAPNYANGQVTASTTAGTLLAARATRRSAVIRNTDSSISVYIGAATVTAANGFLLKAGESVVFDSTALIQVIAASGSPVVSYIEAYD